MQRERRARVEALTAFLGSEDGVNLLQGYKRAVNILKAEEKKGPLPSGEPADLPGAPAEEGILINEIGHMEVELGKALAGQTTMTAPAKHLFYINHPGVEGSTDETALGLGV